MKRTSLLLAGAMLATAPISAQVKEGDTPEYSFRAPIQNGIVLQCTESAAAADTLAGNKAAAADDALDEVEASLEQIFSVAYEMAKKDSRETYISQVLRMYDMCA